MLISVVVPLYNKANSIGETLRSVLCQTYNEFEVIVVDDGSTDGSSEVVKAIVDSRITIINQENSGVSAARNAGILAANGEIISFLDGDDIWAPHYLESLVKLIIEYPDCTIWGLGYGQLTNGKEYSQSNKSFNGYRGIINDVWNNYPGIWTGSSSSRKSILIDVGLFDERMTHGEDMDMWWRLLLNGKGAIDNTTVFAYYVQDAENRAMNRIIPFESHIPFFIEKYEKERMANKSFRKFCDQELLYRLFQYALVPDYKKEVRRVLKQVDFSLQKKSMRWRFFFPRLYAFIKKHRQCSYQ